MVCLLERCIQISSHLKPVSLVDGYNLPMRIDNNVGCGIPSCPVDLGPNCTLLTSSHMSIVLILISYVLRPRSVEGSVRLNGFPCWLQECLRG